MSQFQFVMRSGPTPGVTFPLEGDQLIIGRDASNSIAINDAEISRKHSRLSFQGGKYVLEDLGSTNGTFVNGQRLAGPVVLKPGDVVSLGEQIVLMYDVINYDPGATIASPRAARMAPPPVSTCYSTRCSTCSNANASLFERARKKDKPASLLHWRRCAPLPLPLWQFPLVGGRHVSLVCLPPFPFRLLTFQPTRESNSRVFLFNVIKSFILDGIKMLLCTTF